jgi:peptidoglycan/LPS O-acetylase OafA/YrhL
MIDFTAIAILAVRFRSVLKPLAIRPLVMMGQASLQVFCVHLLCVFFALTIIGNNAMLTGWPAVALVVISLSSLVLTATVVGRRGTKAGVHKLAALNVQAPRAL